MDKKPVTRNFQPEQFPHRYQFLHDFGALIAVWNQFEVGLEIAIARLAGMSPLKASIVLGGLSFGNKPSILYCLLAEEGRTETIEKVRKVIDAARRNSLVHGTPASNEDITEFAFIKRDVKNAYKVQYTEFTPESFRQHYINFEDLYIEAMDELGITLEDINSYAKEARFHWPNPTIFDQR